MFLGEDLLAWLLLALGGALALVRPPTARPGTPEAAVQGTPPRAPLIRSLFYAVLGLLAAVWALATLVSG